MKKLLFCSILIFYATFLNAQPQWKFHIAFEDATGAKDTLWCIWDSLAFSYVVDTMFGEGPVNMDYNAFNVYIGNSNGDTTKVSALDFGGSHQLEVHAINDQYPLMISWDSSMLNTPLPQPVGYVNYARIQSDYFFLFNNSPQNEMFDMRLDDHVTVPSNLGNQSQFPMRFYLIRDPYIGFADQNKREKSINIYPNPFNQRVYISCTDYVSSIEIISDIGNSLMKKSFINPVTINNYELLLCDLKPGFYFIKITNSKNQISFEKAVKLY